MKLDQVELVAPQALERAVDLGARPFEAPLPGLAREEELRPVFGHPAPHRPLRFAIGGGDVDMVDPIFEQEGQRPVVDLGFVGEERGGAKQDAARRMARGAEGRPGDGFRHAGSVVDHLAPPRTVRARDPKSPDRA